MKILLRMVFMLLVFGSAWLGSRVLLKYVCVGQCSGDKACRELCFRQNHCPHGDN